MSRYSLNIFIVVILLLLSIPIGVPAYQKNFGDSTTKETSNPMRSFLQVPLSFEANRGQVENSVNFISRGSGYTLFLNSSEAVLSMQATKQLPDVRMPTDALQKNQKLTDPNRSVVVRMSLVNANEHSKIMGKDELPGKANYFTGNDPKKWQTDIPTYSKVEYSNIYPGIDLMYYGNQRQLEYDFILKPGADPKQITLAFQGIDNMDLDKQGNLVLYVGKETLRQHKPKVYQEIHGVRQPISGSYVLKSKNQVAFQVGKYNSQIPLVIDPILSYATYLSGTNDDKPNRGMAVDAQGHAYVTGYTTSLDFPIQGAIQTTNGGNLDAFITKFNPSGTGLIYSTYLGGSGDEFPSAVTIDSTGNAYIVGGVVSTNFPVQNAFQSSKGGGAFDAFLTKINPTGSALVFSTYLGGGTGNGLDEGLAVVVDGTNHAYVTGFTDSFNFPVTPGAFQESHNDARDGFVTKFAPTGTSLIYSTYVGALDADSVSSIAIDGNGNAYITGLTFSSDWPIANAYQGMIAGSADAFVTVLNPTGTGLVFSTFLGGTGTDDSRDISLDGGGNILVAGVTQSTNFPTSANAHKQTLDGPSDAFITKLNASGSTLIFSSYLGGISTDSIDQLTTDPSGAVYVTGATNSPNFPTVDPLSGSSGSGQEAFVTKIDPGSGTILFSTLLGGSLGDSGNGIGLDAADNIYVLGVTRSLDFPTTPNAFQQNALGVGINTFVAKIEQNLIPFAHAGPDQTVNEGVLVQLDGTGSSDPQNDPLNFAWTQVGGPGVLINNPGTATPTFLAPYISSNQTLTFKLVVDDGTSFSDPDYVDIVVGNINTPPEADAGNDSTIKPGATVVLDGSNSFDNESDPISYQWTQASGTLVTLSDGTAQQPTFTAPNAVGDVLVFKLQVSDGKESSSLSPGTDSAQPDTVAVTMVANSQPIGDAGPDQIKDEGNLVTLNGSGSFDPDGGDTISFQWMQIGGTSVALSSATSSNPTFTAPNVGAGGEDLTFQLIVSDDDSVNPLSSLPDEVNIHIANINDPPTCQAATASLELGWPPTHKMEPVQIQSLADPEGDGIFVTVNGVTQDEPVSGLSNGDSSPDAVIQSGSPTDSVLLRLERDSKGNGRVYVIYFTASDGFENCDGTIEVSVPKSRQSGAVDDGQNFDSTLP